ncbi:hypothetical protein L1987_32489 [Smallanthus sonchifolius]|uniref:Uncharacterized protein n=1 Tax=Smallanthus sonchifolius TaxID=185202 RepID=A0ACB9HN62_9ASTR|nr:hypothetical protein L1987_32489 [Smallanthus sonchifolius]
MERSRGWLSALPKPRLGHFVAARPRVVVPEYQKLYVIRPDPGVLNINLVACSEPERISDRLEDHVSNAPLAFNSQGELSASSLVPRGEGPSNSEVGSQYTDTPMINMDLSLVTGKHSDESFDYELL